MDIIEFRRIMATQNKVDSESEICLLFHEYSQDALKITSELNNKYHTPTEIVDIFARLTDNNVDKSFRLFPPFYTDCGKNIHVGKNVFINACCKFQDQGGIFIDDGVFIGHNVSLLTLNHELNPNDRMSMYPKPIYIGKNVWIGSDSTILSGVKIGDGAVIGAGSVVTKNVESSTIVAGNPAKFLRKIDVE